MSAGRRVAAGLTAVALVVCPVAAQAMSVATFLSKADALKARGILALGSPDIDLLKNEVTTAANAYRADLAADAAAKRAPRSCPPPREQTKVTSTELIGSFQSIPAAQRNVSVKAAFARFMDKRFPCR